MSAKMTSFWFKVSETVLLVLAFLLPLAFFLQTYDGTAIKTTLFEAGTLVLAFAWLFKGLERGRWELPEAARPLALPAVALLAWIAARFAIAPYKLASLPGFLQQVLCIVTYLIALLEFGGAQNARRLFGWITTAAWLAGLYGISQHFGFDPLSWKGAFGAHVFSTLGRPDFFAFFLASCVPLALTQWLDPERDWFMRWTDLGLLALLSWNCVLAASADGGNAFAATSVCAAIILPLLLRSGSSFKASAISVGFLLAAFLSDWTLTAGHPHFDLRAIPLRRALDLGLAGVGLRLWLLAVLAAAVWRARRDFVKQGAIGETYYLAGLSSAAAGLLLIAQCGSASQSLSTSWPMWALAGMLGGLTLLARRSSHICVLPLPMSQTARQRLYAPALLASAGLMFLPFQWFDSEIEYNLAISRANAADWESAISHYDRVRPGAESYVAAQYLKGNAYLAANRAQEALDAYAFLEGLSPDYGRVHYQKGLAYAGLQDWDNASASFARQAQLDPSFASNYFNWAEVAKRSGHLLTAEAAAKAAIALNPNNPLNEEMLAEIYMKEKRVGEAKKLEKQAAQLKNEAKKKPQG